MICSQISELLGFTCQPLSDDGSVALIDTPFSFEDGASVNVFVEKMGSQIRFFDDGEILLHFLGRGVRLDGARQTRFIKTIADSHGVSFTEQGELEIWTSSLTASSAFASFTSTLVGLIEWEKGQIGVASDLSLLISEVALCLQAWKPVAKLTNNPVYTGISGHVYKFDFDFDGQGVIAITPHHASVSSAIKKLVDILSAPDNQKMKIMVVIDDRQDPVGAAKESLILDAVSNVMSMTALEKQAGLSNKLS